MNKLTDFKYNSVDMPLESFHFKYFVTWNFSLSETREMHWCEYHLINKGRALTANGNEALIDLTVQMSPSIHKLWSVSALTLSRTAQSQACQVQSSWQTIRPPRTKTAVWTTDQNFSSERPSHGRIRLLDQHYHFEVDEWTDVWRWTVHLMDRFRRRTTIIYQW